MMIKKFKEAVVILYKKDKDLVEDVMTELADKWNLSFNTHNGYNGYISIQMFYKSHIQFSIQLNMNFDESKIEEFEDELEKCYNKLRNFDFDILPLVWGLKFSEYITYSLQLSREKEYTGRVIETFIEFEKSKHIENKYHKRAELIYKDDELKIYVPKSLDATKKVSDSQWCTNTKGGFYRHNLTSNLYRFHFSDGYMLRLTWDYFDHMGDYSGGTHWGQGGIQNDERAFYHYIRPHDESHPFEFDYNKGDHRQYMVDRIKKIPQKAKDAVYQYQKNHQKEKLSIFNSMYKEIEKIKIVNIEQLDSSKYLYDLILTILYNNKKYQIEASENGYAHFSKDFEKDFKNKYALYDITIRIYLQDKIKEFIKKNKITS